MNNDEGKIIFYEGKNPIIVLSDIGFEYKGKLIKDAGKAHKLFIKYMEKATMRKMSFLKILWILNIILWTSLVTITDNLYIKLLSLIVIVFFSFKLIKEE